MYDIDDRLREPSARAHRIFGEAALMFLAKEEARDPNEPGWVRMLALANGLGHAIAAAVLTATPPEADVKEHLQYLFGCIQAEAHLCLVLAAGPEGTTIQ